MVGGAVASTTAAVLLDTAADVGLILITTEPKNAPSLGQSRPKPSCSQGGLAFGPPVKGA